MMNHRTSIVSASAALIIACVCFYHVVPVRSQTDQWFQVDTNLTIDCGNVGENTTFLCSVSVDWITKDGGIYYEYPSDKLYKLWLVNFIPEGTNVSVACTFQYEEVGGSSETSATMHETPYLDTISESGVAKSPLDKSSLVHVFAEPGVYNASIMVQVQFLLWGGVVLPLEGPFQKSISGRVEVTTQNGDDCSFTETLATSTSAPAVETTTAPHNKTQEEPSQSLSSSVSSVLHLHGVSFLLLTIIILSSSCASWAI